MNEQNLSQKPEATSQPQPIGGRSASPTQAKDLGTPVKSQPLTSGGSSNLGDNKISPAPSILEKTKEPYLARHFKLEKDILRTEGMLQKVQEIDSYIISLVKERNWVDTESSYQDVLKEIAKALGLNENLDVFTRIEKLSLGTRLIKEQRYHEKLARSLKVSIENIKT